VFGQNDSFHGESAVPRITLLLGVFLILLGAIFYLATDMVSVTALIPAFFGVVFMVLGLLGGKENLRKHMMHAAAALGTLGALGGLVMVIRSIAGGVERPLALIESAILAASCALFVFLCVKSFVDARRRRAQRVEMS
jgi:hypothetical protein